MLLTGTRPQILRGVVLNDIGPVLEKEGLRRIQSYVGKLPTPASWAEAVGIEAAIFVGTSRGGLHTMLLTGTRPALLRGVVLNDIGPVLEKEGLRRIQSYVGKLPTPTSWAQAVEIAKGIMGAQFTGISEADWEAYARQTFEETPGGFALRYDPAIMLAFGQMDLDKPIPELWPQFEALAPVPVLAIRGENSDLLSPQTLAEMARRHPHFEAMTVPGQGHAPLLRDEPTLAGIEAFIARVDPR
jgi:pimeloyl-ACP methyl ester carboxylesterase